MLFDVVSLPDGKTLAAGKVGPTDGSSSQVAVIRFNANGSVDSSFGTAGIYTGSFLTTSFDIKLALDSAGRVIVAGNTGGFFGGGNFQIIRLTSAGALDTGFGTSGQTTIDFGVQDELKDVAVDSGDRIVAVGKTRPGGTTSNFAIARLTSAGALDSSFSGDGLASVDIGNFNNDREGAREVRIQSDGKIVVGGDTINASAAVDQAVVRLNDNGSLDTTFGGGDGIVTLNPGVDELGPPANPGGGDQDQDDFGSMGLQSDGKIIVAGTTEIQESTVDRQITVVRLNTNGTLDSSFGGNGIYVLNPLPTFSERHDLTADMTIQQDDKIVLVNGYSDSSTFSDVSMVTRLNADGTYDSGFGTNGVRTLSVFDPAGFPDEKAGAVAIEADGNIVVGITTTFLVNPATFDSLPVDFALFRLEGDPVAPPSAPEINVNDGANVADADIANGGAAGNFGSVAVGSNVVRTFNIDNAAGTADLTVSNITTTGGNAGDFTVGALSPASPISAGNSATFTVTFAPSAVGARTTTLRITNNDGDENPFDFSISGTAPAPPAATIFWADPFTGQEAIYRANANGTAPVVIVDTAVLPNNPGSTTHRVEGMATDANYIYWSDVTHDLICRADHNGSNVQVLVDINAAGFPQGGTSGTSNSPNDVAVNANYIYWTDSGQDSIYRADIDGMNVIVLIDEQTLRDLGFGTSYGQEGIDVDAQYVYWGDSDAGGIFRAQLDGSNPELLIPNASIPASSHGPADGYGVGGVFVTATHIFWADTIMQSVYRAAIDGSNTTVLIDRVGIPAATGGDGIRMPTGIAADSVSLFWSDDHQGALYHSNLDGTSPAILIDKPAFPTSSSGSLIIKPKHIALLSGPAAPVDVEILSLNLVGASPVNVGPAQWDVTFDGPVDGLTAANFDLVASGVTGASITGVTPQGGAAPQAVWRIAVGIGSGSGTLRLDLDDDTGMTPPASNETFAGEVLTIDKTPPAVPTGLDLVAGDDSGSSDTDDITSENMPEITGSGEDGSTVTLNSSLAGNVGSAVVGGGTWSITPGSALADGTHLFTATAADALSNTSAASTPALSVVIDTTAPAAPTGLDLAATSDSALDNDDITNDDTPEIGGDAETGSEVELTSDLDGAVGSGTASSPFAITTTTLQDGVHSLTATATDPAGNTSASSVPLEVTIDTTAPLISGIPAKTLVRNAPPGAASVIVDYGPVSATDINPPAPAVSCLPPSGGSFSIGSTLVACTSTDTAGNVANDSFEVIVLETLPAPGTRFLEVVTLRGDPAPGAGVHPDIAAGVTIFNHTRAFINNVGDIIYEARLTGAPAANDVGVFSTGGGVEQVLAVEGAASGVGAYGTFSELAINDVGTGSFQSLISSKKGHFVQSGGGTTNSALAGLAGGAGPGIEFQGLNKPSLASSGVLLSPANLKLNVGGVISSNDTLIWSSAAGGAPIAREGSASPIAGADYGQYLTRVVSSQANERFAFGSHLVETPFSPSDNTALFVGTLGSAPVAVVREGDTAPGTPGTFLTFPGESINSSGEIAFRSNITGGGSSSSDNEGIWTDAGGAGLQLVAREGEVAPCLPDALVAFERFSTLAIGDDGSVCFFAYLRDATAATVVNSGNDGSIWRFDPVAGQLHLIAREGEIANNTNDAVYNAITEAFACSGTGGLAFQASLVTGVGDTTSTTNTGIWLDRGAPDAVAQLVLRRGDTFDLTPGDTRSVSQLSIDAQTNAGDGTGGYGRAMNDSGDILLKLTLSGSSSGIFKIGVAP